VKLVIATRSAHKMAEIRHILAEVPDLEVLDLDQAGVPPGEEAAEPWDTFEDNARSKARHFQALTGLPTVADDSGLEVDALDGAPGVRSKRFAQDEGAADAALEGPARDDANNRWLVERLQGLAPEERTARYVCVAVLLDGQGRELVARGEAPGLIVEQPRGEGGFGYDPHFFDPELDRTFAQISAVEKNAHSHRGRAFRALAQALAERGGRL